VSGKESTKKLSLVGLNAINFFQAEMVGVVLPVLGGFLKEAGWRYDSIGAATALGAQNVALADVRGGGHESRCVSPFAICGRWCADGRVFRSYSLLSEPRIMD
jgi:hypothetical protein